MSVSKWRYTEECNGRPCPGDCDHCSFEPADLISRADAIADLEELAERYNGTVTADGVDLAIDRIKALPSAEAVSRKAKCCPIAETCMSIDCPVSSEYIGRPSADAVQGEWIEKGGELVCSVCGNSVSFSRTPKGWVLGRFCQTCGARMKGGAE